VQRWRLGACLGAPLALALVAGPGVLGCSKKGPAVVKSAERPTTDDDIDREPFALLPGNAVLVGRLDAHALFASSLGPKVQHVVESLVPIGAAAGFVAERDLESIVGAAYSMQGADAAFVARGTFDPAAFEAAVAKGTPGPYGSPWVKSEHAGRAVYTASDVAFAPLTRKTALAGTNTGLRRALDRLRFGAPKIELPDWAAEISTTSSPLAIAGEWGDQPVASEVVNRAPFLNGVRALHLTGNFDRPGLNLDGQLTYPTAEVAGDAESRLRSMGQLASLASIIGLSPVHDLRSEAKAEKVHVAVSVDGPYLGRWLDVLPTLVPAMVPSAPTPAPASSRDPG
jgi:hypothetical protein